MPEHPAPWWPRGLPEALAAAYVGLSASTFRREVDAGRAPRPVSLTKGRQVWLRETLDRWLDEKAGRPSDRHDPLSIEAAVTSWDAAFDGDGDLAVS